MQQSTPRRTKVRGQIQIMGLNFLETFKITVLVPEMRSLNLRLWLRLRKMNYSLQKPTVHHWCNVTVLRKRHKPMVSFNLWCGFDEQCPWTSVECNNFLPRHGHVFLFQGNGDTFVLRFFEGRDVHNVFSNIDKLRFPSFDVIQVSTFAYNIITIIWIISTT